MKLRCDGLPVINNYPVERIQKYINEAPPQDAIVVDVIRQYRTN